MKTNSLIGRLLGEEGEEEAQVEVVPNAYVDRLKKLEAIGDNADRYREEELVEYNEDGSSDPFIAPAAKEVDEVVAEVEEAEKLAKQASAPAVEQPQKIIRKINGQDVEITDDLIARTMKVGAADVYLEEAARLRKQALEKQKLPPQGVTVEKKVEDDLAFYLEKANAIQMGTPEEAAAVLRELLTKKAETPVVDEAAISKKIDEKLSSRESKRLFDEAYAQFCNDYSDIVKDPMAFQLAQDLDNKLIKQGDTRPFYDRFKASGDAVREWLGTKGAPAQQQSKEQRKAAAPKVPSQATVKHNSQQAEEKEESYSETIAAMAKNRGVHKWMGGSTH